MHKKVKFAVRLAIVFVSFTGCIMEPEPCSRSRPSPLFPGTGTAALHPAQVRGRSSRQHAGDCLGASFVQTLKEAFCLGLKYNMQHLTRGLCELQKISWVWNAGQLTSSVLQCVPYYSASHMVRWFWGIQNTLLYRTLSPFHDTRSPFIAAVGRRRGGEPFLPSLPGIAHNNTDSDSLQNRTRRENSGKQLV